MALSLGATPAISATARAAERLGDAPAAFVQADLLDLPFTPRRFVNVACCGTLHVLDDPSAALIALAGQLAPVGKLPRLDAVTDRTVDRAYLAALHRAGAGGRPRRAE